MISELSQNSGSEKAGLRRRLVLVEEHGILREGLRALLELEADLTIVGEATNGADGLLAVNRLAPDLVLTDVALAGHSGIEFINSLRQSNTQARILVLTAHNSEEYIRAALNAGAHGYVLKDASRQELLQAIQVVLSGQTYLSASVTARVLHGYLRPRSAESQVSPTALVTNREREVLTRVALGRSNKLIARELALSVKTVEKHRANLMRKLTLHNTAAVTRFAICNGLLTAADLETTTAESKSGADGVVLRMRPEALALKTWQTLSSNPPTGGLSQGGPSSESQGKREEQP